MYLLLRWLGMFMVLMLYSSCMMLQSNGIYKQEKKNGAFDAVIIPGVPYQDSAFLNVMNLRVRWAEYLYKNGMTKHIIFSGSAVYTPYVEAYVMGLMAKKLGLPDSIIFYETKAEHSTENLYYGYHLAQSLGFKRIAVASDPMQTYLLSQSNEQFKITDIHFMPMSRDFMKSTRGLAPIEVDASSLRINEGFVALPDRKNSRQRFRGTLGNGVRKAMKELD